MKKISQILKGIVKDFITPVINSFIFNSFWKSFTVLVIIISSLILNAALWYIFVAKIKVNSLPIIFASGLIFLNIILSNFLWEREKIASFFLVSTGLFVQVLMLIFIRFFIMIY